MSGSGQGPRPAPQSGKVTSRRSHGDQRSNRLLFGVNVAPGVPLRAEGSNCRIDRELAAFRDFRDGLAERCDEPPVSTRLERVGEFRMLGLAVAG